MTFATIAQNRRRSGGMAAPVLDDAYLTEAEAEDQGGWAVVLLRSPCSGTAGVIPISGYSLNIPFVGTSPRIIDHRAFLGAAGIVSLQENENLEAPNHGARRPALSAADEVKELLAALSLNKSQLAELLRVARPTVYEWLEGKEPNAANGQRLTSLLELLAKAGVSGSCPLNARFVRQPLGEERISLLDALAVDRLEPARVVPLLKEARALGENAQQRRTAREERLRNLGYEEPSDDQRTERLGRNVAMSEWPK